MEFYRNLFLQSDVSTSAVIIRMAPGTTKFHNKVEKNVIFFYFNAYFVNKKARNKLSYLFWKTFEKKWNLLIRSSFSPRESRWRSPSQDLSAGGFYFSRSLTSLLRALNFPPPPTPCRELASRRGTKTSGLAPTVAFLLFFGLALWRTENSYRITWTLWYHGGHIDVNPMSLFYFCEIRRKSLVLLTCVGCKSGFELWTCKNWF